MVTGRLLWPIIGSVDRVRECMDPIASTRQRDVRMVDRIWRGLKADITVAAVWGDDDCLRAASRHTPCCRAHSRPRYSRETVFACGDLPSNRDIAACVVERQRDRHSVLTLANA